MITFLKITYALVLIAMLYVTVSAALEESITAIPKAVLEDPWFKATLWDAYFGFLSFYVWVCYRESNKAAKLIWFFAIALLGNIAMAVYALLALFKLKEGDSIDKLFVKQ